MVTISQAMASTMSSDLNPRAPATTRVVAACSTCSWWVRGSMPPEGARVVSFPGSRAELGECKSPEYPGVPHNWTGADCGASCARWRER